MVLGLDITKKLEFACAIKARRPTNDCSLKIMCSFIVNENGPISLARCDFWESWASNLPTLCNAYYVIFWFSSCALKTVLFKQFYNQWIMSAKKKRFCWALRFHPTIVCWSLMQVRNFIVFSKTVFSSLVLPNLTYDSPHDCWYYEIFFGKLSPV